MIVNGWTADDILQIAGTMDYQPDDDFPPEEILLDDDQAEAIAMQANEIDACEDAVREMIQDTYGAWIEKQNYLRSIP